ncbi:MAG: GNAT family N-acetyltransferase [Verrucomicrobiales bacterium]
MQVSIRSALQDDAGRITEIYLESRKMFLSYAPLVHSDREVGQWIAEELIPGDVAVAEISGRIVGFLATSRKGGASWIDHLYLSPESVARGVGTKLLRHAMSSLPPPIRLYAFQQNSGGRRFCERFGFRLVALGDGSDNEEICPDALYEFTSDGDGA